MCTKVKPWLRSFPLLLFNISNAATSRGWTEGRTSELRLDRRLAASCCSVPRQPRRGSITALATAQPRYFLFKRRWRETLSPCSPFHHESFPAFFLFSTFFFPPECFFDGVLQLNASLFAEKKADDEQKICAWVLFWQHKSIYGCFLKITHNSGFSIVHKWNFGQILGARCMKK